MLAVMKVDSAPGAKVENVPVPAIGAQDLLIKIRATSICGTDAHIYQWDDWAKSRIKPPIIFGHEMTGEVMEMGKEVTGFSRGDFISAESHIPCGHCFQCRNGQRHICGRLKILGVDTNGSFAEYVILPAVCAWKVPDGLPPEQATILEPLGNAVYATLVDEVVGKSVAVFGCGAQGLFSVGVARAAGAGKIFSVIRHEYRGEIARKMGADAIYNSGKINAAEAILEATGGEGVDVALEMAGSQGAINDALKVVKKGGRLTAFGIPSGPVSIDYAKEIVFKGITIYGINGRRMFETWYQMAGLLQSGALDPTPVITHRFRLTEFEDAMKVMKSQDRQCGKIVLFP